MPPLLLPGGAGEGEEAYSVCLRSTVGEDGTDEDGVVGALVAERFSPNGREIGAAWVLLRGVVCACVCVRVRV